MKDVISIYYCHLDDLQVSEQDHILKLHRLPVEEQERINRLHQRSDRLLSSLGLYLLEFAHGKLPALKRTELNKPYAPNEEICFSISHSGKMVVLAISQKQPLGIDIEQRTKIQLDEFHLIMRPDEIETYTSEESFFELWTAKEAVIKALGTGFHQEVKEIMIQDNQAKLQEQYWQLTPIKIRDGYSCTLAVANSNSHSKIDLIPVTAQDLLPLKKEKENYANS
ncbi:MAG: 4'-phosphopantetheinyl transferase superfamily protein [Bacteroidetes bacterium]|nr:MAG: 4'-phosphopantetheinyl transferase superfamily protein [Bacteroidota bacterium]